MLHIRLRLAMIFNIYFPHKNFIKQGEGIKQKHWPKIDESQFSDDIHVPQSISSAKHH